MATEEEIQKQIASFNAATVRDQLLHAMQSYDYANRQNKQLAQTEIKQNSQQNEADRYNNLRSLQNATRSVTSAMGPAAMSGSGTYALNTLVADQQDADNVSALNTLRQNNNSAWNAYIESYNANNLAKMDAANNAEYSLKNLEADRSAALANIGTEYYEDPNDDTFSANHLFETSMDDTPANVYGASGYQTAMRGYTYNTGDKVRADTKSTPLDEANNVSTQPTKSTSGGTYWQQLQNQYNQRARDKTWMI